MSLTSELKLRDSFTRQFIDDRFPHLATISRRCNQLIRDQGLKKIQPFHKHKIIFMLVGTAMDYRVRAYFGRHIHETDAVIRGLTFLCNMKELKKPYIAPGRVTNIENVSKDFYWEEHVITPNPWYWRRRKRVAERLISSFRNFVARTKPERRRLAPDIEERLCRYCILFAYLDWIGRSPSGSSAIEIMVGIGNPKVPNMLRAVDTDIVNDLVLLSKGFYTQQRELIKSFKKVAFGGTLAGSGDIGGADFDLIIDGCLIDLKASLYPRIDRMHLRQLVGYWLLDYDDAWKIGSAAIILIRHRHTERLDIQRDLIGPIVSVDDLRQEFRQGLRDRATGRRSHSGG